MNGYLNGLLMAIQIVYQPQSKWIINYFPSKSSTSIQVDYRHHQVDNLPLSKCFMNGYPNGISMAIKVVYHL